jgi:hypothetical protein
MPEKCECGTRTKSKASFANQEVEGKGDTFWFNRNEPNERDHQNQKTSNRLTTEAAFSILTKRQGYDSKTICAHKSHEGDFTTNRTEAISQQDSTQATSRK